MTSARYWHTATLLPNGSVLVTGGVYDASSDTLNTAELYDPAGGGAFSFAGNMTSARERHTATSMYNCTALVTGGRYYDGLWHALKTADLYTPAAETCSNPLYRIGVVTVSYPTIQAAYDALNEGETLQIQALTFTGGLLMDQDRTVKLQGGCGSDFTSNLWYTSLSDNLTVKGGTATVENLIIK